MRGVRRVLAGTLAIAVTFGAGAGVGAWWYHTTRPLYRLRSGQEALRQGRPDKADRLARALESGGYSDYAHLLRGEAFLRDHQFERAIDEFKQIQDQGALRVEASAIYGLAFFSVKRTWEAEKLLRYVVSKQPDHLDAHRGLAAIYFDQGALTLAIRHAKECARLEPHRGYPLWFMGVIYTDLADYAAAREAYQEALKRELSSTQVAEVQEGLAEVLTLQKEYVKALVILEERAESMVGKPKMLACRAECLWGLGRAAEAKTLLDKALQEWPDSPELLRLRAKLYLSENEPRKASALLEHAVQRDRHDYQSRYQLAQAYQLLGRQDEAALQRRLCKETQDYFAELTSLNADVAERPWDIAARNRLADVCEKLDKTDLAVMWRQAAAAGIVQP